MRNTKLQKARKQRHWSIDEASLHIGVSRLTYIRWEQGTQRPHGSSLQMICRAFDLSDEQLGFGGPEIEARFLTLTPDELLQRYDEEMLHVSPMASPLPHVVIFDNSQWHLPLGALRLHVIETPYTIPSQIEAQVHDLVESMKDHFFDSATIRLDQLIHNEHELTLVVRKSHYFDYLGTNYLMDAMLPTGRSLRDTVHVERKLEPLESSLLANHIGVSTLAFTEDDYLLLPVRSQEKVGIWQGLLMPSISGATSFDDDIRSGLASAWMREGRDELRLENSEFGKAVFLGITRELLRGGKPEAFFATQISLTREQVERKSRSARDGWENTGLRWVKFTAPLVPSTTEQERTRFLREFSQCIDQGQDSLSQPLQASLALWVKWMLSSF